ncbi:hypothetical protein PR048_016708 [Dryococelus australis]|uniref:Uncharacterized protein n=1 Tax=Dryococelus australis TaxID=614101 RepID=A0ABQ9H7K9_9NEOP|nr:hypothetical protein PR048_016708 [Dryococelus australis]
MSRGWRLRAMTWEAKERLGLYQRALQTEHHTATSNRPSEQFRSRSLSLSSLDSPRLAAPRACRVVTSSLARRLPPLLDSYLASKVSREQCQNAGHGKLKNYKRSRRPAASSGTIPVGPAGNCTQFALVGGEQSNRSTTVAPGKHRRKASLHLLSGQAAASVVMTTLLVDENSDVIRGRRRTYLQARPGRAGPGLVRGLRAPRDFPPGARVRTAAR